MNARDLIRNSSLAQHADILERLLKPAIAIVHAAPEVPAAVGASKLGGEPDLPPGFVWPKWKRRPLAFLAQLRLDELAPYDVEKLLPASGMLYFFNDTKNDWGGREIEGAWRVVYSEAQPDELKRTPLPKPLSETGRFQEVPVRFEPRYTLPFQDEELRLLAPELQLTQQQQSDYDDLVYRLVEWEKGRPLHWMLGYHSAIQGAANVEALQDLYALASDEAIARCQELVLLLQLDSDDKAGMCWGDLGTLYFWIHRDDLATRCFERVWMVAQCY